MCEFTTALLAQVRRERTLSCWVHKHKEVDTFSSITDHSIPKKFVHSFSY